VTDVRPEPYGAELAHAGLARQDADGEHHVVAREQLGAHEDDEREGDAKGSAHNDLHEWRARRRDRGTDREDEGDAEADIGAGERREYEIPNERGSDEGILL